LQYNILMVGDIAINILLARDIAIQYIGGGRYCNKYIDGRRYCNTIYCLSQVASIAINILIGCTY
jgi:hypothetical protein